MNDTAHALGTSRTLWELLDRRAGLTPDRPVLLQDDRTLSFGELRARAERVAAGLHDRGVRPGTVVAWQLPTRIETVLLSFALARLGAVQSPVIPFYRDREVGFALRESKAEFFAVPGEWRGFDHTEMARRLAARGVFEAYDRLPDGDPSTLPAPPADGTSVRWIYWTSGTTSDPKGVLHTDRSLIAGGSCLAHALRLTSDDVGSIAFPYAHIGGPDYMVMLLLYGFPAVLFEHFALPAALEGYREHGVTVAGGSTAFYSMFLAEQRKQPGVPVIPTLRLLAGGGAPKPPEVYHAVVREMGVQLTHGYGMTEVPMITMGAPDDSVENLATTEGRPPAGMEIRIAADGEVRLRGEAVCRGYLDPAQSATAFDADGFFVTGDLGHLTDSGHLVLTGRLKDVIIRKGENISAKEIEDLLHRHPAVRDVAVIGLPDAERGERVCAVVEQPPAAEALTLEAVTSYLRAEGLSVHKLPEQVEVVDALPRNETLRKVLKYKLRERYSGTVK
ncbi:class I adenylate-forming enzyme family protein [Streptomyces stelliscabiei]|uniref:Acyl-CoA synthetase (AMP-forming)/AMP-acid ligase II n=1 Tax=Streptomyces stelliscabiei TaxID=146820 RepID=A0A8I0P6I3_9ACTN|nr:AMP-binding protein [Streptomyces stelliscabiei]KND45708.1 cyclohex-1-ene-1-carboxylate:CoA ligase [Streptomyces stelliscabiei]MBE1598089.1 acyl-CoA synthetase (AMP-forming)/AMP-acid ligase II [Streptomyces stelliscabiei]MDX2515596.1 AMP-binding protein [Streptomyces stelliscabiei]MDX2552194.1 AMP-binding protein [Streptomyces stelliscabiei]MDX2609438.1 AMP-binding protein [Streptomyces stelliscabiei]